MSAHKPFNRRPANNTTSRDDQVIELLNALGQRLIASERERETLKRTLAEIEARTNQTADKFLALQERQGEIESAHKAQAAQIEKAVSLADKIEEAILQQNRVNRRIESMQTERVQMIRKLERIEETVIETQDALNAKALVLLTDQNVAAEGNKPHIAADSTVVAPIKAKNSSTPFWAQPQVVRGLAMAAVLLCAVTAGWAVYALQKPDGLVLGNLVSIRKTTDNTAATTDATTAVTTTAAADIPMPATIANPMPDATETAGTTEAPADNDILHTDDATLLAQMEQDPDALAAQLNAIEPANTPDEAAIETLPADEDEQAAVAAEEPAATPEPVAAAPADTPVVRMSDNANKEAVDKFLAAQKAALKGTLAQRIKPDASLPPVVKDIENKAYTGSAEAQHDLAAIYTAGHGGVKTDYTRAAAWFTEAALQGIANARYNLGVLYHQGLGVPKDVDKAIGWYSAAAALNHPEAQYNLGIAYIEGIGTAYNPQAAAKNFESAANSGIMEAAYNLGLIYENGLLGEMRADKALYWYRKAAKRGSPEAQAAMDQLAKNLGLTPNDIDEFIGRDSSAAPDPLAPAPAPVKKSKVESLRPEDKVDINEVASYIPQVSTTDLNKTVTTATPKAADPGKYRAITAQVQDQLMRLGLYPGPADGISGPQTEDAIRSYQRANKLKTDGRASEALLVHLLTNEMDASTIPDSNEYGSRND